MYMPIVCVFYHVHAHCLCILSFTCPLFVYFIMYMPIVCVFQIMALRSSIHRACKPVSVARYVEIKLLQMYIFRWMLISQPFNKSINLRSSPAKVSSYLPFDKPFTSRPSKFIISADLSTNENARKNFFDNPFLPIRLNIAVYRHLICTAEVQI